MKTTLNELSVGQSAIVLSLGDESENAERLMEMGLVEGTTVEFVKCAPLGDPIEILVRGYHFSLRRHEAQQIEVETE